MQSGGRTTHLARPDAQDAAMAAVKPLDGADPSDRNRWFVIRGTVREGDLASLLDSVQEDDRSDATLDLLEVDDLTLGGCWAIRALADELWRQRRTLTVVFGLDSLSADRLRATGTMGHPHIAFQGTIRD